MCNKMQEEMINQLINKFNDVIDSLINDFKEFNQNEDILAEISKKTRNFVSFTELSLSNVMFAVLAKLKENDYGLDEEITQLKEMIGQIFEKINKALDHILEHDDEDEHAHGHDHSHHHHVHIDIDEVQEDIQEIIIALQFLKKIFKEIFIIVLSSLKYEVGSIEESIYQMEYNKFRENVKNLGQEFTKIFI